MKKTFTQYMEMSPIQLRSEYVKILTAKQKYEDRNGPFAGTPDYGMEDLQIAAANRKIDLRKV